MEIEEIQEYLPHRYPFLFVDRVIELELGKYIKAYKNVTTNEPFFPGHFPDKQVMPGVLILEAMAQWKLGGDWAEITPYVAVLIVIIIRPHGIMGQKEVERI